MKPGLTSIDFASDGERLQESEDPLGGEHIRFGEVPCRGEPEASWTST